VRTLAVDHGEARCGLALSDPTGTVVRPLEAVPPDLGEVARVVDAEEVELVIVGLPVGLSGDEGEQAAMARAWADELADVLPIPVRTYDERFTTVMADATARRSGSTASRDSLAAAHLLESFLQSTSAAREGSR